MHIKLNNEDPAISINPYKIDVFSENKDIFINLNDISNSVIYVFDLMGRLVVNQEGVNNAINKININAKKGMYLVKVIENGNVHSEKVFLK